MKKNALIIFTLLIIPYFSQIEALNRDYYSGGHPHCIEHLTLAELNYQETHLVDAWVKNK